MSRHVAVSLALAVALTVALVGCDLTDVSPQPSGVGPSPVDSGRPTANGSPSAGQTNVPSGLAWVPVEATSESPTARSGHTWTVDPDMGVAYLFGGRAGSSTLDDLWVYDLAADAWQPIDAIGPAPAPRFGHVAAWIDGVGLVVVGGRAADGTALDDLWRFDPDGVAWEPWAVDGARPPARSDACAVTDPTGRLWLSHGLGADGVVLADTWSLDPRTAAWSAVTPSGDAPDARAGAACWWAADARLILFGGSTGAAALGDLWALSTPGLAGAAWVSIDSGTEPAARSDGAAIRHGDRLVVIGGIGADGLPAVASVAFDAETLAHVALAPVTISPTARSAAALVDDPAAERLVLVGGLTAAGPSDEVWQATLP